MCKSLTRMDPNNLFEFKTKSIVFKWKPADSWEKSIEKLLFFKNHTEKSYIIDTKVMLWYSFGKDKRKSLQ